MSFAGCAIKSIQIAGATESAEQKQFAFITIIAI